MNQEKFEIEQGAVLMINTPSKDYEARFFKEKEQILN